MSRGKLLFAHGLIALQVVLALGYYVSNRDVLDERFAWRMFSVQRLARCNVDFRVGAPPAKVALSKTFHQAWITAARRGRKQVIEAMASHLCAKNPGQPVTVVASCKTLGKRRDLSSGGFDLCKTGRL